MKSLDEDYVRIGRAVWNYYQHRCAAQVSAAIKRQALRSPKKLRCVDCGRRATEYDHRSYTRPLDVVPVCHVCNIQRGPADLDTDVIIAHLADSSCMPYENKRLQLMGNVTWREACACCDDETFLPKLQQKYGIRTHSEEKMNTLLTIYP